MKKQLMRLPHLCVALIALTPLLPEPLVAAPTGQTNPIGRVARLFNRKLVRDEDQINWLKSRLSYLAVFAEKPLKEQVGWRCGRLDPAAGDPWIALDLGREYPLGEIFLVPAQRQAGDPLDLFPRRFIIQAANQADFSDARTIHQTGKRAQPSPSGFPVHFDGDKLPARHIRIIFEEGHQCGLKGVCALSEIFVFSERHPVSLGAGVSTGQSVDIPGVWEPNFVVDGRTPLGLWEGGVSTLTESRGHCLEVPADGQDVEWIIDFGQATRIDRVILFP